MTWGGGEALALDKAFSGEIFWVEEAMKTWPCFWGHQDPAQIPASSPQQDEKMEGSFQHPLLSFLAPRVCVRCLAGKSKEGASMCSRLSH